MDDHEAQHLTEAGRRAAQAWIDENQVVGEFVLEEHDEAWLQILVGRDGSAKVIPCTFRPEGEEVSEDGPAVGPGGEPGVGLTLWRPLEYVRLASGTRCAVFVEKEVFDDRGNKRDLWMPM